MIYFQCDSVTPMPAFHSSRETRSLTPLSPANSGFLSSKQLIALGSLETMYHHNPASRRLIVLLGYLPPFVLRVSITHNNNTLLRSEAVPVSKILGGI